MATYGGRDYTDFKNVRVKGTKDGFTEPGIVRIVATDALESTLSVDTTYQDSSYKWTLPAKSGLVGISGTFTVHVPALAANAISQTTVVISGIRVEDGFLCNAISGTYETSVTTNRGVLAVTGARPTNSGVEMIIANVTGTATVWSSVVCAYTAFR